jgi:hypothetical protein
MNEKINRLANEKNTLNILNGQAMYNYFKQHQLDKNGVYAPFNEAMCVGEVIDDIFSDQFNKLRCEAHHITMQEYNESFLKPLEILFSNEFSNIILWFDDDMFCQINLLIILAYLDQKYYRGETTFKLVGQKFKVVNCFEIEVKGYYEIYKQVMINRCIPQNIDLSLMENGIRLYFEYLKEENEITTYIKEHGNLQNNILLTLLFKEFPQYGLGDTQYFQLIGRYREGNII